MEELNLDNDYFNYLLYCHQLSESDGEEIISQLKDDYYGGKVNEFNMIQRLEDYCNRQIITNEKEDKISYLYTIIDSSDYYINQVIVQFRLTQTEIIEIASKIEEDILRDNIPEYIIKRNFRQYASDNDYIKKNKKQLFQIESNLPKILFIQRKIKEVNNITLEDVKVIIDNLKRNVAEGRFYKSHMQSIITKEIEIMSKDKKLTAQKQLINIVEKAPENYEGLLRHFKLSEKQGEDLLNQINQLILDGKIEKNEIKFTLLKKAEKIKGDVQ